MTKIEIEALTKRFGDHVAVDNLDLVIEDGEFITLLGPSGCGKTTTLRMLAGFIQPDDGVIRVDGKVVSSREFTIAPEHRGMGMVFQNYALWPHKSVFDNVAFGVRMQKVSRAQTQPIVERMLTTVGLGGYGARYPHELSGGQQQRVALARSLVTEPSILLLDEPLSNLDAKLRDQMRMELQEIQARTGITFIYVTHDQSEAMSMSSRIAVMRTGRLRQFGRPRDVYFSPVDPQVADFMGLINFLPGEIVGVEAGARPTVAVQVASGQVVRAVSAPGVVPRIGDRTTVAVRPESITLGGIREGSALEGVVARSMLLGNINYCFVDVGDDGAPKELRVQLSGTAELQVSTKVGVSFSPELATAFPHADADDAEADPDESGRLQSIR